MGDYIIVSIVITRINQRALIIVSQNVVLNKYNSLK